MRKVLLINSGSIYLAIHQTDKFLSTIKDPTIYDYFKENFKNELSLPSLTVCDIVYDWQPNVYNEDYYVILKTDDRMCIMKSHSNGFEYITEKFKLILLKQIFEYYDGED